MQSSAKRCCGSRASATYCATVRFDLPRYSMTSAFVMAGGVGTVAGCAAALVGICLLWYAPMRSLASKKMHALARVSMALQGRQRMRDGFNDIVSGWTLVDDWDDLTDRIERSAEWVAANGPLQPDEEATIKLMIESQIARGE